MVQYAYDTTGKINQAQDAISLLGGRNPHVFYIADGYRGERVDPTGGDYAVDSMAAGNVAINTLQVLTPGQTPVPAPGFAARVQHNVDELGNVTTSYKDGRGRTLGHLYPESDQDLFFYDANDNVLELRKQARSGTPEAATDIVISATYEPVWNKLASVTDALGNTTTLAYYAAHTTGASLMQTATRPKPSGASQPPVYTFTYNGFGQPLASTDPTGVQVLNAYDTTSQSPTNLLVSTTVDPGAGHINSTTNFINDALGNPIAVEDPNYSPTNKTTTNYVYDGDRRKLFEIQPAIATDPLHHRPSVKHTYDPAGRETETDKGFGIAADGSDFSTEETDVIAYDAVGNKVEVTTPANIIQIAYDGMNRATCTALRMDATKYGSLPSDACALTTAWAHHNPGPDQPRRSTTPRAKKCSSSAASASPRPRASPRPCRRTTRPTSTARTANKSR